MPANTVLHRATLMHRNGGLPSPSPLMAASPMSVHRHEQSPQEQPRALGAPTGLTGSLAAAQPHGCHGPTGGPGWEAASPGAVLVPVGLLQGTPAAAAVLSGRHTYDY